jgi:hypothetical protein
MFRRLFPTQIVPAYFRSYWMPGAFCFACLGAFALAGFIRWAPMDAVAPAFLLTAALAWVGIAAAGLWNLVKRRWGRAAVNLLLLPLAFVAARAAIMAVMFASMFGPSEDRFADALEIPAGLEVALPGESLEEQPGHAGDAFQSRLRESLRVPGSEDRTVTAGIGSLASLHRARPELLLRYLASHPGWRVYTERGRKFATRRWKVGPEWSITLHGYYSEFGRTEGADAFQSRFTIGFSGQPWSGQGHGVTRLSPGQTSSVNLTEGNGLHQSLCIVSDDALVVEIFEQSGAPERRMTRAALDFTEAEFAALAAAGNWKDAQALLPPDAIVRAAPSLDLRNSFQPGLYDAVIRVNPGEPGSIHLRAFEVTQGTRLSADRLKEATNEWVGWSEDLGEVFLSNTHFTIYEGDWDKPYAARFAVWFTPDAGGGRERKLLERVFKIEGWQR